MATKLEAPRGKALVNGPLKKITFFATYLINKEQQGS